MKQENGSSQFKLCTKCGKFAKHSLNRRTKDGLTTWCVQCGKVYRAKLKLLPKLNLEQIKCTKCQLLKTIDNFPRSSYNRTGVNSWCKQCQYQTTKDWIKTPQGKESQRHFQLKRLYGITLATYDTLLKEQQSVCAICGKSETEYLSLSVDHCHSTGKVRGLLCHRCNKALGFFNDDLVLLSKAIQYLKRNSYRSPAQPTN